jgi:hypothetical protein
MNRLIEKRESDERQREVRTDFHRPLACNNHAKDEDSQKDGETHTQWREQDEGSVMRASVPPDYTGELKKGCPFAFSISLGFRLAT